MYSSLKKSYPVLENYRGGGGGGGGFGGGGGGGRGGGFGGGGFGGAGGIGGGLGGGIPMGGGGAGGLPMGGVPVSGGGALGRPAYGHFNGVGHTPIRPVGPSHYGGHAVRPIVRGYPYFAYGQNGYGGYGDFGYYPNTYNYTTVNNNTTCFCQDPELINSVPMQYQICPQDTTDCGVCIPRSKCKNCNNNYSC